MVTVLLNNYNIPKSVYTYKRAYIYMNDIQFFFHNINAYIIIIKR